MKLRRILILTFILFSLILFFINCQEEKDNNTNVSNNNITDKDTSKDTSKNENTNTNSSSTEKKTEEKKVITMNHYWDESFKEIQKVIFEVGDAFNKKNKKHKITIKPLDHESLKVSILNIKENMPDLYSYWAGIRLADLVAKGNVLAPLDDIWEEAGMDNKFSSSIIKAGSEYNGKKYGIPITTFYVTTFYNKKIFDEYSLKPPKTWDEFLEVCETLKTNGITPIALGARDNWPSQFWFDYFLLHTAGYQYRLDLLNGKKSFTDPEVQRVFRDYYGLLVKKGYINKEPAKYTANDSYDMIFKEKKAAMVLIGQWAVGYFESLGLKEEVDFDFFSFPKIDDVPITILGVVDMIVLTKEAANPEGAKEMLKFLSTPEAQSIIMKGSGGLPANINVPDSELTPMKIRIKKELATGKYWHFSLDSDAIKPVYEAVWSGIQELLIFPDQYEDILKDVDKKVKDIFSSSN